MAFDPKIILWCICLSAALILAPFQTSAFQGAAENQLDLLVKPANNRQVIIFDNDYLDRRFGRSRAAQTPVVDVLPAAVEQTLYTFSGPLIVDVPAPRRTAEVLPNGSLLKGIKRNTPARRAAALRLAEVGRTLLQNGQNRKALYYLERALGMEASPFLYFYLARAHFQLADYQSARRFLTVAERGFSESPEWLPEVIALKEALVGASRQTQPARNVSWTFNE